MTVWEVYQTVYYCYIVNPFTFYIVLKFLAEAVRYIHTIIHFNRNYCKCVYVFFVCLCISLLNIINVTKRVFQFHFKFIKYNPWTQRRATYVQYMYITFNRGVYHFCGAISWPIKILHSYLVYDITFYKSHMAIEFKLHINSNYYT